VIDAVIVSLWRRREGRYRKGGDFNRFCHIRFWSLRKSLGSVYS
jgi:hypothetical protein